MDQPKEIACEVTKAPGSVEWLCRRPDEHTGMPIVAIGTLAAVKSDARNAYPSSPVSFADVGFDPSFYNLPVHRAVDG